MLTVDNSSHPNDCPYALLALFFSFISAGVVSLSVCTRDKKKTKEEPEVQTIAVKNKTNNQRAVADVPNATMNQQPDIIRTSNLQKEPERPAVLVEDDDQQCEAMALFMEHSGNVSTSSVIRQERRLREEFEVAQGDPDRYASARTDPLDRYSAATGKNNDLVEVADFTFSQLSKTTTGSAPSALPTTSATLDPTLNSAYFLKPPSPSAKAAPSNTASKPNAVRQTSARRTRGNSCSSTAKTQRDAKDTNRQKMVQLTATDASSPCDPSKRQLIPLSPVSNEMTPACVEIVSDSSILAPNLADADVSIVRKEREDGEVVSPNKAAAGKRQRASIDYSPDDYKQKLPLTENGESEYCISVDNDETQRSGSEAPNAEEKTQRFGRPRNNTQAGHKRRSKSRKPEDL